MIVQQPTAEFEMNISDRSFVTNATYQTDAQSKFSVKTRLAKAREVIDVDNIVVPMLSK